MGQGRGGLSAADGGLRVTIPSPPSDPRSPPPAGASIRAAVVHRPTRSVSEVDVIDVPLPALLPTELRIRVEAASLGPRDVMRMRMIGGMSGELTSSQGGGHAGGLVRDAPHNPPLFPYPYVLGTDGAGIVVEVGESVTGFQLGDRVAFLTDWSKSSGSLAEVTTVESASAFPLVAASPVGEGEGAVAKDLSFSDAAALPTAGCVAYIALFDKLRVQPNACVVIHGATGGVGVVATQLARWSGCHVIASCSDYNVAFARSLGAHEVIDHHKQDVRDEVLSITKGYGADYLLDLSGVCDGTSARLMEAVRFGGSVCFPHAALTRIPEFCLSRQLSLHYVYLQGLQQSALTRSVLSQVGCAVVTLFHRGAFRVYVEVVKTEQIVDALHQVSGGHTRGRLVVLVGRNTAVGAARPPGS